ncbi:MAG: ABC transporter ATP-binding protein [Cellulosilyticaceae bacterium]
MSLNLEAVTIGYGKRKIIDRLDLQLEEGEVVALLGCNGMGKSTLFKAILGLIPIQEGSIRINDQALDGCRMRERAKYVGYMPQHTTLGQQLYVREFVTMGLTPYLGLWEVPSKAHYAQAEGILEELELLHFAERLVDELSGGERQRVYLARLLLQDPVWMILDEPTASLDYKRQHQILASLRALAHERGKGVFFSIHDPNLALRYADRIVLVHDGRVLGSFKIDETLDTTYLIQQLRHVYDQSLELITYHKQHMIIWN